MRIAEIQAADICLGIFGDTDKASRVIPNKVFQTLCSGRPLITRDSPAMRELVSPGEPGITLVPPADATAILEAIHRLARQRPSLALPLFRSVVPRIMPVCIGYRLVQLIKECREAKT